MLVHKAAWLCAATHIRRNAAADQVNEEGARWRGYKPPNYGLSQQEPRLESSRLSGRGKEVHYGTIKSLSEQMRTQIGIGLLSLSAIQPRMIR